jgi:hypothetical protein
MNHHIKIGQLPLFVLVLGLLAGCSPSPKATTLTADQQAAVLAYSEAKTDNLLAGLKAGDYAMFSKDFDPAMLSAMTQAQFEALKKDRDAKLGAYVSRQVSSVVQTGNYFAVSYDTKFEKDDNVTVRVVFQAAEPHQVSGLWFNK